LFLQNRQEDGKRSCGCFKEQKRQFGATAGGRKTQLLLLLLLPLDEATSSSSISRH